MSRQLPSEASLRTRIGRRLRGLARVVPDNDNTFANPRLDRWPDWINQLLANVALLGALDPLGALRAMGMLECRLCQMDSLHNGPELNAIHEAWDRARVLRRSLYGAVAQRDHDGLVSRVTTLLREENLMDRDDAAPRELLVGLGRDGRQEVMLRLADTQKERGLGSWTDSSRLTELLLAEPTAGDMLEVVARLGIQELVAPTPVMRRLLAEKASDKDVLEWMRRALADSIGEEDADARPDRPGAAACEAEGRLELAQEIRLVAFEVLFDPKALRDRLERLAAPQREAELARAMRHATTDERRMQALLFLAAWPDLEAAARLVRLHHKAMDEASCDTFIRLARLLRPVDPVAALLLCRQAVLRVFDAGMDARTLIDECEAMWRRHHHYAIESHDAFLDRLQEYAPGWR